MYYGISYLLKTFYERSILYIESNCRNKLNAAVRSFLWPHL